MASASWPAHIDAAGIYFVTTSAVGRKHVFRRDLIKRILVDSLNTGRILGQYQLFAFVIMPNHVHVIVRCLGEYAIGDVVRELKKATSNLILRQLEAEGNEKALAVLAAAAEHTKKKDHAIWEEEYQAKDVFSPNFLRQKVEYTHNNPCQPHWQLAAKPEEYVWSSAAFYLTGRRALIPLSNVRDFLA